MAQIMGILNLTPDSFYAPSRHNMAMLDSGADIIDIGACSTRPGHTPVGAEEEWRRLEPVLRMIAAERPELKISIDTYWSDVVRRAYEVIGPFIVNDVEAGDADPEMLSTVAELGLPYVPMHHTEADSVDEIVTFYEEFEAKANELGIKDWIIDPGFGFNKDVDQNWAILRGLSKLRKFGRPILVGVSRKRMTGGSLEVTQQAHEEALRQGADILRVHDVQEAKLTMLRVLGEPDQDPGK